jgi:hypothetical protein
VTESGLAGTPRAWLAPLAAAAAVVVVGGGIALATAGGGGNSTAGPGQAAGPGPSASTGGEYGVTGCGSIGSPVASLGKGFPATEVSSRPPYPPTVSPTGSAGGDVGSTAPVVQPTHIESPTVASGTRSITGSATSVPDLPTSMPATASEVPLPPNSSAPIEIVSTSVEIVICSAGTATPGAATVPGELCTKSHHALTCSGAGDCATAEATSSGPYNSVLCVDEGSGNYVPLSPTATSAAMTPVYSASSACECNATDSPSSSADDFSINTHVAPGESKTFDGPDLSPGQVLDVEAMVFQNPAADTGTLSLAGDKQNRLSLDLSDFRDLDYHFDDQPLVYDADHPLRITVDCTNSATACTPAVLVSGQLTGQ